MRRRLAKTLIRAVICAAFGATMAGSTATAEIVQAPGTNYLVFQAEDFTVDDRNSEETGWQIIDPADPQEFLFEDAEGTLLVPPANTNMSGRALFDPVGGGDFADQVGWELNFATPGEYYVYVRYSLYDLRNLIDPGYGNEDSIYVPPYELTDDPAGSSTEVRDERAGQSSLARKIGIDFEDTGQVDTTPLDGCRIPEEPWVIPEEECDRSALSFEGQYHWQKLRFSDNSQENVHASYVIEQTGVALDFAIATRERGSSLDAFVFSQDSELTISDLDALLNPAPGGVEPLDNGTLTDPVERADYVHNVLHTWVGDSNLDGQFNSGDLVEVFTQGQYEDGVAGNSSWVTGDWNGDKEFDTTDFVAAFSDGGYEQGARGATAAVPEPTGLTLLLIGSLACLPRKRS